jgi:hypothetical protein
MLIDFDILEKMGTDKSAIRKLFTAQATDDNFDKRDAWEKVIQSRISEGVAWNTTNYQWFASADLIWDSNMITKELVPLSLYAQGKITAQMVAAQLKDLSPETLATFVRETPAGPVISIPDFCKVVVNLGRSFITRRTAAIVTKYDALFPFFEYEPLSTSFVAKLKADVLSQRIEMIANAYGFRHDNEQIVREVLMYGRTLEFVTCAWDVERGLRKTKDGGVESFIAREGMSYARPHQTRVFFDSSYPLSSINTDSGCEYLGYWNITKFRGINKNPKFFNREEITRTSSVATRIAAARNFLELYYSTSPVNFPSDQRSDTLMAANERERATGVYSSEDYDRSVVLTEYFEKIIPSEKGLGTYPHPVWIRLIVAGDKTVVYGEFLPSTPANYYNYNCHDGKILNNSFLHDSMPWTDQTSNMLTNLLYAQKAALIRIISMDVGQLTEENVKKIRAIVEGGEIYSAPILAEFRMDQYRDMGINPKDAIQVAETTAINDITMYMRSLMQIVALAEKMLGMSSNESAQSEPREISATESANISSVVNTTLAFMSRGIDEGLDAKKRQIYESFMAMGASKIVSPVVGRYMPATIKAAGFTVLKEGEEQVYEGSRPLQVTLEGDKTAIEYDYNFSSRDGSERPSNIKAAEVLVNLLAPLLNIEGFPQKLGQDRLFTLVNHIIKLSGAGVDARLGMNDGEDGKMPAGDAVTDNQKAVEDAIMTLTKAIETDRARIQKIQQQINPQPVQQTAPPV